LNLTTIYETIKYLIDKKDPNWQAGILCLVEPIRWTGGILKNHILGWFMKGFFLPLMFQAARSAPLAALEMYGR
jgi:hypothetical protein